MIYFMYAITFICVFNLLVMAFIVWKFGLEVVKDVFFVENEETSKDVVLERTQ